VRGDLLVVDELTADLERARSTTGSAEADRERRVDDDDIGPL
jgi:hypothetical protein